MSRSKGIILFASPASGWPGSTVMIVLPETALALYGDNASIIPGVTRPILSEPARRITTSDSSFPAARSSFLAAHMRTLISVYLAVSPPNL